MSESDMQPQNPHSARARRAAWILVIIMSVLLALAFVAVVWGFIRQGQKLTEGSQPTAAANGGIVLPPGTRILSSSTDAGRLVLQLQTPQGPEIRIIDLTSGRLVQTIKAAP